MTIGVIAAAAGLWADPGDPVPVEVIQVPQPWHVRLLSDAEKESALNVVKASGVIKNISGGQDWEAENFFRVKIAGAGTEGIRLEAVWDDPVDSAGPWYFIKCAGTRKLMSTQPWNQITRILFWVDMENEAVAGFVPFFRKGEILPTPEAGHEEKVGKIYDVESGDIVYDGTLGSLPSKERFCLPGTIYRD